MGLRQPPAAELEFVQARSAMKAFVSALFVLCVISASAPASAATRAQVMQSRYMKYQFCMEKVYGQGYAKTLKLDLVLNKWGNSEPTLASLSKTSDSVQKTEARCRAENELNHEPRPQ
jgi:hypothetical protein